MFGQPAYFLQMTGRLKIVTHYNSNLIGVIIRACHSPHISHLKIPKNFIKPQGQVFPVNIFFNIPPPIYLLIPFLSEELLAFRKFQSHNKFFFPPQEQTVGIYLRAAPAALHPAQHPAACSQDRAKEPSQEARHNQ
jgi:hypothetical protein